MKTLLFYVRTHYYPPPPFADCQASLLLVLIVSDVFIILF